MAEQELLKKIADYERRMGLGEHDPTKDAYLVYVDILRQQTDYLKNFKIKSIIASEEKAAQVEYKNAKDLWENLPNIIEQVGKLKVLLKMEGEQKKITYTPISAKEIASGSV